MRLDSIRLVNYRCFLDRTVEFDKQFNVLVGTNGSGKTSLLTGICESLACFANYIQSPHHFSLLGEGAVAYREVISENGRVRFENRYPVAIHSRMFAFNKTMEWAVTKTSELAFPAGGNQFPGIAFQQLDVTNPAAAQAATDVVVPLVAFYRANRSWNAPSPNEMQAATKRNSRFDGLANWFNASLDASAFQTWAISKSLERLQTSSSTGIQFDSVVDDELALVNVALSNAVEGAKGIRYDLTLKSLMIDWIGSANRGAATPFESLSDGQRALVGLVADIARRMCLINPTLESNVTRDTPGIVLIDELDMHLHPHWQRIITRSLKTAFPSIQFIVASHSPQILGELAPNEIILLRTDGGPHPAVSYGLDSSRVLQEIMGTESRPIAVEEQLKSIFSTLESNDLSLARAQIDALSKASPGLPEIVRAEALLMRKETIGR